MKIKTLVWFLFGITFLFYGCQKDLPLEGNPLLNKIPGDATFVAQIDLPQLRQKGDLENIRELPFFKGMLEDTEFKEPGIDTEQPAYFYFLLNPKDINEGFFGLAFQLTEPATMQKLLETNGNTVQQEDDLFFYLGNEEIVVWNKAGQCLIGFSDTGMDPKKEAFRYFATTAENGISQNRDFQKCMETPHDLTFWMTLNALAKNEDARLALSLAEIKPSALEENFVHGFLDFEKGMIESRLRWSLQKELTKDLDKLFKDKPAEDLARFMPEEYPTFYFSHSINPKGWNEVLSARPQYKSFLGYALKEYGITIEDFVRTFKGDFSIGFFEPAEQEKFAGLFVTNIGDAELLKKFLQLGQEKNLLEPVQPDLFRVKVFNSFFPTSLRVETAAIYLWVDDDHVFITGNEKLMQQVQAGTMPGNTKLSELSQEKLLSFLINRPKKLTSFEDEVFPVDAGVSSLSISVDRKGADANFYLENKDMNSLKFWLTKIAAENME